MHGQKVGSYRNMIAVHEHHCRNRQIISVLLSGRLPKQLQRRPGLGKSVEV